MVARENLDSKVKNLVGASAGMTLYTSQENQGNADANGTRPEKSRHEATETEIRSSDSTRMGQNA